MGHSRYGHAASLLLSLAIPVWGVLATTAHAQVGIGVSITLAPPALPVYAQPEVPGPGYLWTPGYWAWGEGDYYWVPGTWIQAPQPGYLWTPGYWGWGDGAYLWHGGYWGAHIGFYGGVNYGFGYGGSGYEGGYWDHDHFFYNSSVSNVRGNTQITNVYNKTVINNTTASRVSFNGGQGGTAAQPTASERAAASESHLPPVQAQVQHEQVARSTPALRAAANHGSPAIAATAHAGVLSGAGVVATGGRAPAAPPAQVSNRPAIGNPAASPHVAPLQHAAVKPASPPPASPPAAPATPERLAARPVTPAAPHAAVPKPPAPRPPAAHPPEKDGGEHDR
jgi:hypothetical protein